MDKDCEFHICIGDVYDLAADIGKEFEKMIDNYGHEPIHNLMVKVIMILEYLEAGTIVNENYQSELSELRTRIAQLEFDRTEKAEYRHRLDQDLEHIEDSWRKETAQLTELVTRLKEENHRLSSSLAEKESCMLHKCRAGLSDMDVKVVQRMKEVMEKQREQLSAKEEQITEKNNSIEVLQQQMEQLAQLNRELNHRLRHLQSQMHILVEEKSDLQAQVQDQQRRITTLQTNLKEVAQENMELVKIETAQIIDLKGKQIIDLDDPNRPRFTLDELRHILFERNDLKAKISDLEDELGLYKPKSLQRLDRFCHVLDDDPPVQGPINKEPDEKLYPNRKISGIRRFFPSIGWPRLT